MEQTQLSLTDTVRVSDDVVFCELEGEAVILNLDTGIYFGPNEVGTRIWNLLQETGSLQKAFAVVQQEYNVAPDLLREDLLRLVGEMRQKGLIDVSPTQPLPS